MPSRITRGGFQLHRFKYERNSYYKSWLRLKKQLVPYRIIGEHEIVLDEILALVILDLRLRRMALAGREIGNGNERVRPAFSFSPITFPPLRHAALSRGPHATFLIGRICIASRWLKLRAELFNATTFLSWHLGYHGHS
jgi:hypothetical protein